MHGIELGLESALPPDLPAVRREFLGWGYANLPDNGERGFFFFPLLGVRGGTQENCVRGIISAWLEAALPSKQLHGLRQNCF